MSTESSNLWQRLQTKDYRDAFAAVQFKRFVPFQITALRKQRGWSQERLAEASGLTQGVISRAEDPDYGNLTVNTILAIARGFDVAFIGRFVSFSELDSWLKVLSERNYVPSFDEEKERRKARFTLVTTIVSEGNRPSRIKLPEASGNQSKLTYIESVRQGREEEEELLARAARG